MSPSDRAPNAHHQQMALQYLYNATRSLAFATGKVEGFKEWAKAHHTTHLYLAALAVHLNGQPWPWEPAEDRTPGPQGVRQEADKADEPGTGGSPGP